MNIDSSGLNTSSSELDIWQHYYSNNKESLERRKKADSDFVKYFRCTAKNYFFYFLDMKLEEKEFTDTCEYLNKIHDEAWLLLYKYGVEYRPINISKFNVHKLKEQSIPGKCYRNSFSVVFGLNPHIGRTKFSYVEGICLGLHVSAMLHVWNCIGSTNRAIDWTFYSCTTWNRYFGIPFTEEECRELFFKNSGKEFSSHLLFHKDRFGKVESNVLDILSRRQPLRD